MCDHKNLEQMKSHRAGDLLKEPGPNFRNQDHCHPRMVLQRKTG